MTREWTGEIPSPSQEARDRHQQMYGRPMTQADERLHGLREAGYKGWIDQDGRPVSEAEHQADIDRWAASQEAKGLRYHPGRGWVRQDQEASR